MKIHVPIFFLALTVGGILIGVLGSFRDESKAASAPIKQAKIRELSNLGHSKYTSATEYTLFAQTADAEHESDAARLFRALACSERMHEINCAEAVRQLGGHYTPPFKVVVMRGVTQANLTTALNKEVQYDKYFRSGVIEEALGLNNRHFARILIRIAGGNTRQRELLEQFILHPDSERYAVCPQCGNLWRAERCDHYCPLCHTSERQFIPIE